MANNVLVVSGIGSTDWAGGAAPAGGTHTGTSVITMLDGATFTVAESRAGVLTKMGSASARTNPQWVSFDQPGSGVPITLNVGNIRTVT